MNGLARTVGALVGENQSERVNETQVAGEKKVLCFRFSGICSAENLSNRTHADTRMREGTALYTPCKSLRTRNTAQVQDEKTLKNETRAVLMV